MKRVLRADIEHLTTLLVTLHVHYRRTRSINLLGSALKVLAGTPDFDDLQRTRLIEHDLINANNKQVLLNSKLQNQINAFTHAVNAILNEVGNI